MEEEYKGKIKYYEDELEVLFPIDFNIFKTKVSEMLGLTEDFLNNIRFSYKDVIGNKNEIKNLQDYQLFIKNIKDKEDLVTLLVEIKDESDNKLMNQSNIMPNINIENKYNLNNINNFVNDSNKLDNKNINNININNNNNFIRNNFGKYNNDINHNNININNNINNNKINRENNNNFLNLQPNYNKQIHERNNNQISSFVCSYSCSNCNISPISGLMYYCPHCKLIMCPRCESIIGASHQHSYYKIQNKSQYDYLHLDEAIKRKNNMFNFENMKGAFNNALNYFVNDNNKMNSNNRNNFQGIQNNKRLDLVAMARNSYDLTNITDQQIRDALKKTNNDIDSAIILLTANQ